MGGTRDIWYESRMNLRVLCGAHGGGRHGRAVWIRLKSQQMFWLSALTVPSYMWIIVADWGIISPSVHHFQGQKIICHQKHENNH